MSESELSAKVRAIIKDHYGSVTKDTVEDSDTLESFGGDSLALMELVLFLETELDVIIEDEQLANVSTVGDLIKLVEKING